MATDGPLYDMSVPLSQYWSDDVEAYAWQGTHYGEAVSLIHIGLFNFCMCHDAEANLIYIRDGLKHIGEPKPPFGTPHTVYHAWYEAWRERGLAHFGSHQAREFFFYWADAQGLTDHGAGIPGWLTDEGKHLISLIDDALAEDARHENIS